MEEAQKWIENLALQQHPEGGFYRETYRSPGVIGSECLSADFAGPRSISTSIFYLLRSGEKSHFHRIKSDEVWYFHAGTSITLVMLRDEGTERVRLGPGVEKNEKLQFAVPANTWFGAFVTEPDSFALCSCHVAPGFDFHDFEMGSRDELLKQFPAGKPEIEMLTRV